MSGEERGKPDRFVTNIEAQSANVMERIFGASWQWKVKLEGRPMVSWLPDYDMGFAYTARQARRRARRAARRLVERRRKLIAREERRRERPQFSETLEF